MPHDYLSPALPLTGAETLIVSQQDPATGKFRPRRVTVSDLLTLLAKGKSEADAAQDTALEAEAVARREADEAEASARQAALAGQDAQLVSIEKAVAALGDRLADAEEAETALAGRVQAAEGALSAQGQAIDSQAGRLANAEARLTAREAVDSDQGSRITAIEGRPEEAAHFTASAKLPAITALQPVTLALTSLTPARPGDVLRKGEPVTVTPATALPAGVNIAAAYVPADGTVAVQLTTGISIALGTVPVAWGITVHR